MSGPTDAPLPPPSKPGRPFDRTPQDEVMHKCAEQFARCKRMEDEHDRWHAALLEIQRMSSSCTIADAQAVVGRALAGVR